MITKSIIFVAALCIGTGVSAQPMKTGRIVATSPRSTMKTHHVVLENIIGRVQMDALIAQVVSDAPALVARDDARRGGTYAAVGSVAARSQS